MYRYHYRRGSSTDCCPLPPNVHTLCEFDLSRKYFDRFLWNMLFWTCRDKRFANAHEVTVVAGSKNRIEKSTTAQVVTAAQLMHYYEYFGFINTHNIALIKLEKKLVIDNVNTGIMKVAFLPPPVHSECVSLGWGRLYDVHTYNTIRQSCTTICTTII